MASCCWSALQWISYYPAQSNMGLCQSFGAEALAICGAEHPPDLYHILEKNDKAGLQNMLSSGRLLKAVNPAKSSTAYKQLCSAQPVGNSTAALG